MARGFIPAGLRSGPETIQRGDSVRSGKQDLRLLRSRTGINPLTTGIYPRWVAKQPQTIQRGDSVRSDKQDLRLLRSRTGINPLTTGDSFQTFHGRAFGWMVWRG